MSSIIYIYYTNYKNYIIMRIGSVLPSDSLDVKNSAEQAVLKIARA